MMRIGVAAIACCLIAAPSAHGLDSTVTAFGLHVERFDADWAELSATITERGRFNEELVERLENRLDRIRALIGAVGGDAVAIRTGKVERWRSTRIRKKTKVLGGQVVVNVRCEDMRFYEPVLLILDEHNTHPTRPKSCGLSQDSTRQQYLIRMAVADAAREASSATGELGIDLGGPVEVIVNPAVRELMDNPYLKDRYHAYMRAVGNPAAASWNREKPMVTAAGAVLVRYGIQ